MSASDTFLRATITKRTEISKDLWVIRVDPGGPFAFTAGQYATLGVSTAQGLVERAYSIVPSPYEPELEFFFELVPDGDLTPLLYRRTAGDALTIRKRPKGRFLLDQTSGRTNHLLLCTVTGIAPFVSFARTVPWLTYVPTISRPWDEPDWRGERGRVDDVIRKYANRWSLDAQRTTA